MRKAVVLVALLAGACATNPSVLKSAQIPVVQNTGLPSPTTADLTSASRPYQIGPFDQLAVDVFGIAALSNKQVQTDASGRISLPLVGTVEAAGKTPQEVATIIEDRLRGKYVRNPQVAVNLVQTVSQVVTVDGQVTKPGLYPVLGRMKLQRAVATAGGLSEFAKLNDVVVFRTVNGQRMAGLYNLGAIRAGAYDDPEIYANDLVVVGDSPARRLFKDVLSASSLITTPLLILFRK